MGVLSATEAPYFAKVWNDKTALKFAVFPFLIMILVWLIKELFKRELERENETKVFLVLSEFCWDLWSFSLASYMLFLFLYLSLIPTIAEFEVTLIGAIILLLILLAYAYEYRKNFKDYYKGKWLLIRGILVAASGLIVYVIFLVVP